MQVHLFGVTSSPSCASFSLKKKKKKKKKTAADNQADFDEEIINTVNRNVYLDDCLKSVPSIGDAIHLSQ